MYIHSPYETWKYKEVNTYKTDNFLTMYRHVLHTSGMAFRYTKAFMFPWSSTYREARGKRRLINEIIIEGRKYYQIQLLVDFFKDAWIASLLKKHIEMKFLLRCFQTVKKLKLDKYRHSHKWVAATSVRDSRW